MFRVNDPKGHTVFITDSPTVLWSYIGHICLVNGVELGEFVALSDVVDCMLENGLEVFGHEIEKIG